MNTQRILNSRLIIDEMFSDRNYIKIKPTLKFVLDSVETFESTNNSNYLNSMYKFEDEEIVLFYLTDDSQKTTLLEYFTSTNIKYSFVIVSFREFSKSISNKFKEKTNFQVFYLEDELLLNPTKHFSVPKHTFIWPKTDCSNYPTILIDDPICKWYWAKRGQIAVIHRENLANDSAVSGSIYYRLVK